MALIETVTVAVAPAASVPETADKVVQVCVFAAVQSMGDPPVFCRPYRLACRRERTADSDRTRTIRSAGITARAPAGDETVRVTARVVLPVPLVVFVKVTVSL